MLRRMGIGELPQCAGFEALLQEYADECALDNMPHDYNVDMYMALEASGALRTFAAFADDVLIGFILVIVTVLPKYTETVAATESFFVAKQYRGTGAGLRLLRAAEDEATEAGAFGILVSAPSGGVLAEVMPRIDRYRESNRVFFRELNR